MEKLKAFVLMPFKQPFDSYYSAIFRPALESRGFEVHRGDDIYTPRPVMLDIQESIMASDIVLCEMTGRNPNVFYELGLAHAAGKPAILLTANEEDIPFDLRHVRVICYETQMAGWEDRLRRSIENAAAAAIQSDNRWPPPLIGKGQVTHDLGGRAQPPSDSHEDPRIVARPINLGFDGAVDRGFPHGWFDSHLYVTGVSRDYAVRVVERDDGVPGLCLMMFKANSKPGEFGSVMQRFRAKFLAGCSIRLQGQLRTEAVSGWAGLWLRADGEEIPDLFFDNMSGHKATGTSAWTTYVLEAQLPRETAWLNLGIVLSGKGTVWADTLRLARWDDIGEWTDL